MCRCHPLRIFVFWCVCDSTAVWLVFCHREINGSPFVGRGRVRAHVWTAEAYVRKRGVNVWTNQTMVTQIAFFFFSLSCKCSQFLHFLVHLGPQDAWNEEMLSRNSWFAIGHMIGWDPVGTKPRTQISFQRQDFSHNSKVPEHVVTEITSTHQGHHSLNVQDC